MILRNLFQTQTISLTKSNQLVVQIEDKAKQNETWNNCEENTKNGRRFGFT